MSKQSDPPLAPRAALRWNVVRRTVEEIRPRTILELGCGMGGFGMRLAQLAPGGYTAVEPDDGSFEVARQRIESVGGTVIHGDHNKVPTGTQYDLVCAFEVLEHIADDAAALADWLPLVKPGGHLLLSVPSDPERFNAWDTLVGHYRRYSAEQLRARLVEAGTAEPRLVHYGWPLGYLLDSVRDKMAGKREDGAAETAEERTSGSGRILQPTGALAGGLIKVAVSPFVALQRMRPSRGPGLVSVAARPVA